MSTADQPDKPWKWIYEIERFQFAWSREGSERHQFNDITSAEQVWRLNQEPRIINDIAFYRSSIQPKHNGSLSPSEAVRPMIEQAW